MSSRVPINPPPHATHPPQLVSEQIKMRRLMSTFRCLSKSEVSEPWQVWGLCVIKGEKHNVLWNHCDLKVNSAWSQMKQNCVFPIIISLWLKNPSIVHHYSSRICHFKADDVMKWCLNDASLMNKRLKVASWSCLEPAHVLPEYGLFMNHRSCYFSWWFFFMLMSACETDSWC